MLTEEIMRKFKNVSSEPIHLDLIARTVTLKPGETAALPLSRDVRYYSRLRKLSVVKEKKKLEKRHIQVPSFSPPKVEVKAKEPEVSEFKPKKKNKRRRTSKPAEETLLVQEDKVEEKPMEMENN